jgi:molecular chaperone HtpG
MKKFNFQIELSRVLEILSNDIYDSPYALLRENIQNAYDAILMRQAAFKIDSFVPKIDVIIENKIVSIADNGIGMDEHVLQNNFWKAGSSGKNNETARKAGVVGTFGIGAMANFGVAEKISVISRNLNDDQTLSTSAIRENLSVTEECIDFQIAENRREEPGTTVTAQLDEKVQITEQGALKYLSPYIKYAKIPIFINGKLASTNDYLENLFVENISLESELNLKIESEQVKCLVRVFLMKNSQLKIHITNIEFKETQLVGEIVLEQGGANIYGLRNYFGLAPLPIPSHFNFGGVANLSNLHPTAGREALSRESIECVTHILRVVEDEIAVGISKFDIIDSNSSFLNYIVNRGRYELSGKIKIELKPDNLQITLDETAQKIDGKEVYFYGGRDQSIINTFGNENSYVLSLSQNNPRRKIQVNTLRAKVIKEVPDRPTISKILEKNDLSLAQFSLQIRMSTVLTEDYLLPDNEIIFAEISHNVPSIIEEKDGAIKLYLSVKSGALLNVINSYETAREVFDGFVKDFVRSYLYPKLAPYIPSSTRQGAETLHKILMRNKELYKYESEDFGELDSFLSDYMSGAMEFSEVIRRSNEVRATHTQFVKPSQVGNAEEEIPNIAQVEADSSNNKMIGDLSAVPPIDRTDNETKKKLLKTSIKYPQLNNFSLFLSLSERVCRKQLDFFREPHTTKVMWGMHRVVYIFTHASNNISLYYDIELKERLMDDATGGMQIPTTTIITKNKIFIPIIDELSKHFVLIEGKKEFFVRHDLITDFSKTD